VIPSLPMWARMLALTHPENWSPHACRAATRIFISNMKPPQAQLFLSVVLLDAIREDIQNNKKLNPQYYESLKRALYKPGAFFKGLIFPMLDVCAWLVVQLNLEFYQSSTARLLAERSCHRCFGLGENQNPSFACICSPSPHS
jgi:Bystin